jgi:hypothetical protein
MALAMAFTIGPIAYVVIFVKIEALSLAMLQIVSPLTYVLIIGSDSPVQTHVPALAVSLTV